MCRFCSYLQKIHISVDNSLFRYYYENNKYTIKCNEQEMTLRITAFRKPPAVQDGNKARLSPHLQAVLVKGICRVVKIGSHR